MKEIKNKVCSKCGIEKELGEFHKKRSLKSGLSSECKACSKSRNKKLYFKNRDKILKYKKEYLARNRDAILKYHKEYYIDNKEMVKSKEKVYRAKNLKKIAEKTKEYRQNNRNKINKTKRIYKNNKYFSNLEFNIKIKVKARIGIALRMQEVSKKYKTIELLGCDFAFYKKYLESLFTEGMTWERLRAGEIHIDHIRPCASFNLTNPEEQKKCFHYTNTQPLWAEDNLSKGARIIA